jgi:hypothetical protein
MGNGPLRRFLHLERPRPARGAEPADAPSPTAGRFDGVEQPAHGPRPAQRTGAQLDRFGPEPEPGIELAETAAGARPFTRCLRCGMDHNVFATSCTGCAASLDTPEQHAFNERLWAGRQVEAAREAATAKERQALRDSAGTEEARARRELGETLAREVGDRERARLDREEPGFGGWGAGSGGGGGKHDRSPIGMRILRLIPDPRWRLAAGIGGAALALGLLVAGLLGARAPLALGVIVLVVLFAPPGFRRGGWR